MYLAWSDAKALSEQDSEYLRWPWNRPDPDPKKSRKINGGEMSIRHAGEVVAFPLATPDAEFI
jgi:hypothetical protein